MEAPSIPLEAYYTFGRLVGCAKMFIDEHRESALIPPRSFRHLDIVDKKMRFAVKASQLPKTTQEAILRRFDNIKKLLPEWMHIAGFACPHAMTQQESSKFLEGILFQIRDEQQQRRKHFFEKTRKEQEND